MDGIVKGEGSNAVFKRLDDDEIILCFLLISHWQRVRSTKLVQQLQRLEVHHLS